MSWPRISRGRLIAIVAAAVIVVAGLVVWGVLDSGKPSPGPVPSVLSNGTAPVLRAKAACNEVEQVQAAVKANGDKNRVFALLGVANQEMAFAADGDPIWLSLQSGIQSITRGLQQNDANASQLGIAIARDQCRRAGVYLPGAVRPSPGG